MKRTRQAILLNELSLKLGNNRQHDRSQQNVLNAIEDAIAEALGEIDEHKALSDITRKQLIISVEEHRKQIYEKNVQEIFNSFIEIIKLKD